MEGIEKKLPLMDELTLAENEINEKCNNSIEELPITLMDALVEMGKDELIKTVLGESLTKKYIELKTSEWMDYIKTVHPWEIRRYLSTY
jgi:glutamine synthetase